MEGLYDERENLTNSLTTMEQAIQSKDTQIEKFDRYSKEQEFITAKLNAKIKELEPQLAEQELKFEEESRFHRETKLILNDL